MRRKTSNSIIALGTFDKFFSFFLVVCILQTTISLLVLTAKKYRQIPNLFLLALFTLFLIHYLFYLFEYLNIIVNNHFKASALMPFQLLPPVLVYLYFYTSLKEYITGVRALYKHLLAFIFGIVFFIPIVFDSFSGSTTFFEIYSHFYRLIFGFTIVFMYFIYARKIVLTYANFHKITETRMRKILLQFPKKMKRIWAMIIALLAIAIVYLAELFAVVFVGDIHKYIDFIISLTLFGLSLLISYIFIKSPRTDIEA